MASIGWGAPSNTLDKYLNANTQPTIPSVETPPAEETITDVSEWHAQKMEVDAIRKMSDEELLQRYQSAKAEQERIANLSDEDLMRQYQEAKASLLSANPQEPKEAMGGFEYLRKRWEADGVNFTGPEWKKNLDATLMALTPFMGKIARTEKARSLGSLISIAKGEFDVNDKFVQDRFHDQLLAYHSGLDNPEIAKKRVQSEALRQAIAMAESRQAVENEISERGTTAMGTIFGKGSEIVGQAGEALVPGGLATKALVSGATEAAARYAEHANGKIGYDENGNPVILDGDSTGKAIREALEGGGKTGAIEFFGGKVLGKVWGATGGKLVGKAAGSTLGQKVAENGIVKGITKIINMLKTPLETLGWAGIPGEVGEEFLDGAIDAYFGLNTTDAEERGTTAGGRFKEFAGDFFKGENLADLAGSMLLMQAIGGGSAYLQKRRTNKQLKIITEKIGGVSENVLNKLSPEEKARIIESHYNGLSAEEASTIINKGAGALDKFMIEKQTEATKSADGRAMLAEKNPEAADAIRAARREGKDISRKMIRDLGLSEKVLGDVESRNKFGDALLEDGRKLAAKNAAKMDGQHEMALRQEIGKFTYDTSEAQRVYDRIVMKLKDASVLDDPYQREQLVMQAAEAVYAEDQARRVGGARQKARMAEKADHEARLAEAEALAAEQAQRTEKDAQERTNAEMMARETKRYNDFMLAREEARAKGGLNETRTDETPAQPEQAVAVAPPAGEAARPLEAGKAPSEVGGAVETAQKPAEAAKTKVEPTKKAKTEQNVSKAEVANKKTANTKEFIKLTENDGKVYEVELPEIKIPNTFHKATSQADWLKQMEEIGALGDELRAKTPFHSVINKKTGNYYSSNSEVAKQRRREVFAYEEAVRRALDKAYNIIGEENDSWIEEDTHSSAPQSTDKKTARVAEKAEAKRNESGSKAEIKKPTMSLKANPKKAAEVVKEFVSKDETRKLLKNIHYDHRNGVAVATDGRVLIVTKHGYDPNAKNTTDDFPDWTHYVPKFTRKGGGQTITIDPNAVLEATKTVKKLASGIKSDNMIRINLPNGEHTYMSVNTLSRVAKAMAANGITEITTEGPFKPLLAKNNDTTIVAMPMKNGDGDVKLGRNDETRIVTFDLESGKVISAPESKISKERRDFAEKLRADIAEGRAKEIEWLRTTDLYKGLIAAQKKGETDAKKAYEGATRKEGSWDELKESNKKLFAELLVTKDTAELENRFSEYSAKMKDSKKQSPRNDWVERTPKELAKLEKEIAAEDAIDAMMADAEPKTAPKSEPKAEQKVPKAAKKTVETSKKEDLTKLSEKELEDRLDKIVNDNSIEAEDAKQLMTPLKAELARRKAKKTTPNSDVLNEYDEINKPLGWFADDNGSSYSATEMIDRGWTFEKVKVGAVYRYRLSKAGVGYHDLSSKAVKSKSRPGNYARAIKLLEEYSASHTKQNLRKPAEITPVEAMKKLGTLGAADVDTLTKAMHREERLGHTERANMIRVLRDYKRGVGTNTKPQSDETSGGKYRASVEAAKPLDDPAFVAWAKKRGVAPTTQKRNEYDKAMADTLKNRLGRWIKGVTVEWVNFIAPEEGGDLRAAKEVTPAVTEASGHHSEGASRTGVSINDSAVALNRKPTVAKENDDIVRFSVDAVKRHIQSYENGDRNVNVDSLPQMLQGLGRMFGMRYKGRSRYATYEVKLGNVTLRLSEHNANGANFANDPEGSYVSVYIEGVTYPHKRTTIPYTEIRYSNETYLRNPRGVANEIVSGVKSLLDNGDFETTLGLGEKKVYPVETTITPAEDAAYLDAVKRGDMKTAKSMVREAAAKAMPDTKVLDDDGLPLMVYHTSDWNPLSESDGNAVFDGKKIKEGSLGRVFYFSRKQEGQYGKNTTKAYLNIKNPFNVDKDAGRILSEKESERFYKALDGEVLGEYKPETMGELFAAFKDESTFPDAMRAIGYDGIVDEGRGYFGAFDSNQIKSVEITSKGDGNVIPLSQRFNPANEDIRYLHDGERIVGSYNRATGEVKLAKGASVETVLHELGWHAARHWAEVNADSDPKAKALLEQMKKYAEPAPKEIKDAVRDVYGDLDADTLLDEIGAARFTKDQSGKIAEALATKEGSAWYQKVWNKVVDFFKNFLTKIGYNRVDLDGVENMSPEVFGDFLADVMMSGKQLGERTAFSMEAPKGLAAKWTNNRSDYKAPIAELEKRTTGSSNNIYYLARTLEGQAQRGKNRAERASKRVKKILGDDISPELLAQYMQLKAYEERNAKIKRRNNKKDASGMTPEDARAIEKTINDSGVDEAIFEEAAQILWDLQIEGLQARVDAGLLDNHTAVKWMIDEPHHVPWRDAIDPDSGEYVGRKVGASEFDTAEGRKTAASGDPITWMLQEYQDAMTRAAQNRLRSSIANLTRLNGDVGIIYDGIQTDSKGKRSFIKYPKKGSHGTAKVLSIPEGVKIESTVKNDGGMKNVLTFKEGGETKYLVLNGTLGEAVAGAVTGRTLARPPAWISGTMRLYAATATSLSPAFAVRNITADNFDIHNNLVAKYGWIKGEKMFAKIIKEQFLMTKQLGSYIKNGDFKLDKDGKATDFQKLVEAYEDAGGLIGGMATEGYDATVKKIQADFRAGRNKARSIGKSVATYWTMMQKMSELAPRLAVFKAAMDSGMSAKEAAMLSREITVDFNKKGEKTPWFNTLWMFSNSALGANLTQVKHLATKGGLKLAGGLVMYGFAEGMLEALMNNDDDEREKEGLASGEDINEYTRQNSLYIRRGDKIFRVNIHMGPFAYAKYFGNVMARAFSGMISPEKAAKELGLTAAEVAASFTGLGNVSGDALVQTAVPTVLQPFVQMATNKDYAGRAVYRTKFTASKPDSAHGRKSTPAFYHQVASFLNEITGGNEARKGWIDVAPETVKMLTEMVGKNFAKDIIEISETGYKLLSGNAKDLDVRNVPFAGDVVRKQEGNDNRFYENYNRYRDDKYELKNNSDLKGDERRAFLKEHPWLYSAGKPGVTRIDNIVKRIEKLRDVEESDRATEERKAEAKAMRRKLQARVIEIMKGK